MILSLKIKVSHMITKGGYVSLGSYLHIKKSELTVRLICVEYIPHRILKSRKPEISLSFVKNNYSPLVFVIVACIVRHKVDVLSPVNIEI